MERLLISQLLKWKNSHGRKALILEGARQVGKTWLLKEFGRKYFKDVCYINFEQSDVLEEIFAGDLSPQRMKEQLSIYNGKMIIPEETLIIFDEVQEMPRVWNCIGKDIHPNGRFAPVSCHTRETTVQKPSTSPSICSSF